MPENKSNWWTRIKHFFDFDARHREQYQQWDRFAENGDEESRYKLLMLYYDGKEEFYPLAFKWAIVVANAGEDCGVMLQVGEMYKNGDGVPKNDEKALLWFERALSLHIIQGKNSPLSAQDANYMQDQIQKLRSRVEESVD